MKFEIMERGKKWGLTIQDALEKEKCQYPHAPLRSIPKLDFPLFTPHTLSTAFSWSPTQKVKTKASPDFLCQWLERISTVRIMCALLRPVVAHEGCADVLVWLSWLKLSGCCCASGGDAGCRCDADSGASFHGAGGDAEKENFQSKSNGAVQAFHLNQGEPSIFEKRGRKRTKQGRINHRCLIRNGNGKKVRKSWSGRNKGEIPESDHLLEHLSPSSRLQAGASSSCVAL